MKQEKNNKPANSWDSIIIKEVKVAAYTIPTDSPESDGTIKWDSTTLILVEIAAGNNKGIGYSYANEASAYFIQKNLKELVEGKDAMQIPSIVESIVHSVRNNGNSSVIAMAISAIDNALWDLKGKLLDLPLVSLLGKFHDGFQIYGSGGFTSYSIDRLQKQLGGWAEQGLRQVKMKIGRYPEKDVERVKKAREAIGKNTQLFVDANAAYTARQALDFAWHFSDFNVTWFEEPVAANNLKGLHFVREQAPPVMQIAAGEYGYNLPYFQEMMNSGAVDVLQADATRCGGISSFLKAGHTCEAYQLPFSSHCAPALHMHPAMSLPSFYTGEYFYDHVRIEKMLFDGVPEPVNGKLYPDMSRPGFGFGFKHKDAEKYKV
jgi:L-alanine-DL-glutamate epimerase-like enolase superfamily enzyme